MNEPVVTNQPSGQTPDATRTFHVIAAGYSENMTPTDEPSGTTKILLAIDDDPIRVHAIRAVADWLPGDADVVALHVGPSSVDSTTLAPTAAAPIAAGGLAGYPVATVGTLPSDEEIDGAARETARLAANAIDGTARAERGDPVQTIVQVAEEIDADLVVIGTGDRSWLSRLFRPSVGVTVAAEAPCSVLVVRPPDEAQDARR